MCWWRGSARAAPSPEFRATSSCSGKRKIISIGVEPEGSPVIAQTLAGEPIQPGPHGIQGIGAGFIPDTLDLEMVDRIELAGDEESIEMARRLAREEGIISGISCGAAVAAAVRVAQSRRCRGKRWW
jgi:cysteine synthase A